MKKIAGTAKRASPCLVAVRNVGGLLLGDGASNDPASARYGLDGGN
jgi:hypothetical protein